MTLGATQQALLVFWCFSFEQVVIRSPTRLFPVIHCLSLQCHSLQVFLFFGKFHFHFPVLSL